MKKENIVSFRFDIDTITGIEYGLSPLLKLAKEFGIHFSFFINMGKSFNMRSFVYRIKNHQKTITDDDKPCKQRLLKRLGTVGLLKTVLFNPRLGLTYRNEIMRIIEEGHELGLHGGHSHPLWQYKLKDMSMDEIRISVEWAVKKAQDIYNINPCGFAAPGFATDSRVEKVLEELGFCYTGDIMSGLPRKSSHSSLFLIPANLIGPKGVPIIEHLSCAGYSEKETVNLIWKRMEKMPFVGLYGHPVFEGRKINILTDLIKLCLNSGKHIIVHRQICDIINNYSNR